MLTMEGQMFISHIENTEFIDKEKKGSYSQGTIRGFQL